MSKSAKSKVKRIFAALLVGVLISGAVPFSPLVGIMPQPMVVKASNDDFTRLLQNDDGGYYYYLPYQDEETLDLSDRNVGFEFDVRTERDGEEGYGTNCDDRVCIIAPSNARIEVTGSISTEEDRDFLNIYDGSNDDFTNLFSGSGEKSVDLISSQNQIYIQFSSDGSVASDGVNLHIRFVEWIPHDINVEQAEGGTVALSDNITSAKKGQEITVTATPEYEDGFTFAGIHVVDEDGKEVNTVFDKWNNDNVATFKMPDKAVTVKPLFLDGSIPEELLYTFESGDKQLVIPQSVKAFRVTNSGEDQSGTLQIIAPEGCVLSIDGNLHTTGESNYCVFDGENNSGTRLTESQEDERRGYDYVTDDVITSGNKAFIEYNMTNLNGEIFGLDVRVYERSPYRLDCVQTQGGTVTVTGNLGEACVGDIVEITATPDTANGYMLCDVSVFDVFGNDIKVESCNWYDGNTGTFRMPNRRVIITANFTDKYTADGGLHIDMPSKGTKEITIPEGIRSFKIYGDNGKDKGVSNAFCGNLKLTAPDGCIFVIDGDVNVSCYSHFVTVYDGDDTSGDCLFFDHEHQPSLPYTTTGNVTFIASDYEWCEEGNDESTIDLTVRVINLNENHQVTLKSATGGQLTATPSEGVIGTDVTIQPNLMSGYKLAGLEITDTDGEPVSFTGGKWYSDIAYFKIPDTNVTVTPTFTNNLTAEGGLSVDMPYSGKLFVNVPAEVKSFKVIDDGKNNSSSDGYVVINAPENCRVVVSGTVTSEEENYSYFAVADNTGDGEEVSGNDFFSTSDASKTFSVVSDTNRIYIRREGIRALDLKVAIIDPNAENSITAVSSEYGTVSASVDAAKWEDEFTVTAVGASGFVPKKIILKDTNGIVIDEKLVDFTTGTATFKGASKNPLKKREAA